MLVLSYGFTGASWNRCTGIDVWAVLYEFIGANYADELLDTQ